MDKHPPSLASRAFDEIKAVVQHTHDVLLGHICMLKAPPCGILFKLQPLGRPLHVVTCTTFAPTTAHTVRHLWKHSANVQLAVLQAPTLELMLFIYSLRVVAKNCSMVATCVARNRMGTHTWPSQVHRATKRKHR